MPTSSWLWPGSVVTRVIDGDTVEANLPLSVDLGFRRSMVVTTPVKLRLARINTPALKTPAGQRARDRVAILLLPGPVEIETLKTYKYGGGDVPEWMAEVHLGPSFGNLSDLLVEEGLAVYWDGAGPRPGD